MTKYLFILFSALALGHISIAFADDHSGTINITGSINAHTCEVAAASKDFTVALGQFHPQDFLQTGAVTSMQAFIITLENVHMKSRRRRSHSMVNPTLTVRSC